VGQRAGQLKQPVGERGLAMIDVRDDREIPNVLGIHKKKTKRASIQRALSMLPPRAAATEQLESAFLPR
jgi:hypothetical protein